MSQRLRSAFLTRIFHSLKICAPDCENLRLGGGRPSATGRDCPPLLCAPRPAERLAPSLFAVLLALVLLARWVVLWRLPVPVCGLRSLCGLPCPLCGGTRSLLALSNLDLWGALQLNPLVFGVSLGLGLWFLHWLVFHSTRRDFLDRRPAQLARLTSPRIFIPLFLCHWIYLCLSLPR